jgi:D-glycero-D-manno-heptose 1,7-bisphosphate phosphatase
VTRAGVLFDRDGTLNENPPFYVKSLAEFVPYPGAFEAVARLCLAGWPVAVCTNQSCVGRGIIGAEVVDEVNRECARLLEDAGGRFAGFHTCPHAPDDGCECRKPLPGLLRAAAAAHAIDLDASYFVGDSPEDMAAGRAAGATPLLVRTGRGAEAAADHPREHTFPTIVEAVEWILRA